MRLSALACHVPERRIEAEEIITGAGGRRSDARVFTQLFGIERVAVSDTGQSVSERFAPVLHSLARFPPRNPIDALIYVHGLPTSYTPGRCPFAELRRRHPRLFGSARLFYELDQHNCAGVFWALEMARQLLESQLARCVAILAGDSLADLPQSRRYVPGCTLIGDAFVALLLDAEPEGIQIGAIALEQRPEFAFGLDGSESEIRAFNQAHDQMVKEALTAVGFRWDGEEKLLPHNVNKLIWLPFCRRHQFDAQRLNLGLLPDTGHCYTTDPFLLLHRLIADRTPMGDTVSLLSVGLGAYTGACRVDLSRLRRLGSGSEVSSILAVPPCDIEEDHARDHSQVDHAILS
jgi:3-oxoacyl-[acyl-carrier-protein] synthase III